MAGNVADELLGGVVGGESPPYDSFDALPDGERERVVERLLDGALGRRWLRGWPGLDQSLAGRLLDYEDDFRTKRRDVTLVVAMVKSTDDHVLRHAAALASGPAAFDFWRRLSADVSRLRAIAGQLARGEDQVAAETTLDLVVLDPLDPWGLGSDIRGEIAEGGLRSRFPTVRGLAAEYLAEANPTVLLRSLESLVRDPDERMRSVAWRVAFQQSRETTRDLAFSLLGDEDVSLATRRSALLASGEYLPTDELVDLLTWFVAHPDPDLAGDAANLLHALHRNPLIAEAALHSPHAHVRETAERLLDPLRGSPAAGGNRAGSPVDTGAIFEELLRRETQRGE